MKRIAIIITALAVALTPTFGRSGGHSSQSSKPAKPTRVESYTRSNGTVTHSHDRALPGERKGRSHHKGGK
jgi:hypothetical protein